MAKKENTAIAEETIERKYELRRLKDKDLFPVIDIISKVLPEDLITVIANSSKKGKSIEDIGKLIAARALKAILMNITKVHDELYALLSDVSGIPAKEIEEMEFGTTPMMIMDIVKNEKNSGFFSALSKLL